MGRAAIVAVWTVCLSTVFVMGQPVSAQQPSGAQAQSGTQPPSATQPPSTTQSAAGQTPAAPLPVTVMDGAPLYGSNDVSITLQYWLATGHPVMGTGHQNTSGVSSALDFSGHPLPAPGAELTFPVGKLNAMHVSYFRIQGVGNPTAPTALEIYGISFNQGDYLATHYTMQNAKLSFDYLSWPFPVKKSKFHIKTLWEVQFAEINSGIDAPLRHGQTDITGSPIQTFTYGKNWFISPSLGLGADYHFNSKLRFEARASGFAIPHHSTIWDTSATLCYRFGKTELEAGAKAFHFKTSPGQIEFVHATYPGVFVGLRWYPETIRH